ncbi:MAG: dienelactone hydrolase family protein, partial [Chitinophagaceae bacterium]
YISFIYHDTTISKKRPAILVIPEWWGVNDYTKSRAKQLAGLGYIAMATDMYGNAKIAATPDEATTLSDPFYTNPTLTKTVLDAAMRKISTFPQTDTNEIAAIGYCYGGYVVLNAAKLGANLKGVISVHGGLEGVAPDKNLLKAKILICQGGADSFTLPGLPAFKKQMDSVGADYSVIVYPNATHAFSNPAATELGKKFNMPIRYNAAADSASWKDIQTFLQKTF